MPAQLHLAKCNTHRRRFHCFGKSTPTLSRNGGALVLQDPVQAPEDEATRAIGDIKTGAKCQTNDVFHCKCKAMAHVSYMEANLSGDTNYKRFLSSMKPGEFRISRTQNYEQRH